MKVINMKRNIMIIVFVTIITILMYFLTLSYKRTHNLTEVHIKAGVDKFRDFVINVVMDRNEREEFSQTYEDEANNSTNSEFD
jgi:hypothetical protein